MRRLAAAPLLLLLLLLVAPTQANFFDDIVQQISGLFRSYEEAPYTVVSTGPGYEERLYPARKWVCKRETDPAVGQDLSKVFWPLFNYIAGRNAREEKIPMTVPVSTKFTVRSAIAKTYEMCFYIGEDNQEDPAEPTSGSGVFIQERPELRVLTRTVGGYITNEEEWMQEAGELAAVLQDNGITVDLSEVYWVGYDAPMKFWGRRNEVWFPQPN